MIEEAGVIDRRPETEERPSIRGDLFAAPQPQGALANGGGTQRSEPETKRVAYLVNAYPRVSHSFIRREILALERRGVDVLRFSIRPVDEPLPDPDDRREQARTAILLDGRYALLMLAAFRTALARPVRFVGALRMALAMAGRGAASLLRHIAYLVEACRLARLLQAAGVRHLHVHFGTNPAAVARLVKALTGISYSMTVHGPDEFDAPAPLSLAEKVADAAFTVAISDYGRAQLMRWSSVDDWPRIRVVRCGIDRGFQDGRPVADRAGLTSKTLLCVARLSAQKGLPLLLDAAAAVAADGAAFELRLVGDGELRPQLEARIVELGLAGHVRLVGWRGADGVRSELLSARALVLPSFAEGLPVVLMEALALGRPVVTTAIAGVPELVDRSCGWLVPAGSVDALAQALRSVLKADADTLAIMGAAGRARVRARHDVDANAETLVQLLRPLA